MPAHFEIDRAHLWRHCYVIFGGKRFSRRLETELRPFSRLQSLNQTRWKQTFYIKNVWEDFTFAVMIKKVDTSFLVCTKGQKPRISGYFEVQATYLPVGRQEPHQTCRKGVFQCFTTS